MNSHPISPDNPWLGLQPFGEANKEYFFGRKREVEEIFSALKHQRFTLLFGRSGNGKTSLLNAGLVPLLKQRGYLPVVVRLIFSNPQSRFDGEGLVPQTLRKAAEALGARGLVEFQAGATQADGLWEWAHDMKVGLSAQGAPKMILVIDQFEELFTLGKSFPDQVQAFMQSLADLVENTPPKALRAKLESNPSLVDRFDFESSPCRVLITIRADFLSELERFRKQMPSLARNRYQLDLLAGSEALEAVYRPGTIRSSSMPIISRELAESIVRRIAGATNETPLDEIEAVPPLVSLFCAGLNDNRLKQRPIPPQIDALFVTSCADQILPDFYKTAFERLPVFAESGATLDEQQTALIRSIVEEHLVTESGYRQSIPWDDAVATLKRGGVEKSGEVLDALITRRLLTADQRDGVQRLELTHDLLLPEVKDSRSRRREIEARISAELRQQRIKKTEGLIEFLLKALPDNVSSLSVMSDLFGEIQRYYSALSSEERESSEARRNHAELDRCMAETNKKLLSRLSDQSKSESTLGANSVTLTGYDIYISYSRRDNSNGAITALVEELRRLFRHFTGQQLSVFFDSTEVMSMDDWRHQQLHGLRQSRILLACLSPSYLQSEYCEWEFLEYLKHEKGRAYVGEGVAPIYLVDVPGFEDPGFELRYSAWVSELRRRQYFDLRPLANEGAAGLQREEVRRRLDLLVQQMASKRICARLAFEALGNVDPRNLQFTGRVNELRRMRESLALGQRRTLVILSGLGGVGKTALAIEYAHAFSNEYGGGRWQVRCEGKAELRAAIAELATPLALEFSEYEKKDADRQLQHVLAELRRQADTREPHRCLLLLDNVDNPQFLEPARAQHLFDAEWLHIIVTSRLGESELCGGHNVFLLVNELPETDALELIETYQPKGRFPSEGERAAAQEIAHLLGGFPMAIEMAAAYLGQFAGEVTCAGFLSRLRTEGLEGLDVAVNQSGGLIMHREKGLHVTLRPTLAGLTQSELCSLQFAALLAPDAVAIPWIRTLVSRQFPDIGQDAKPGHPDPWRSILRRLISLHLLQPPHVFEAAGLPLLTRIHRLVRDSVMRDMPLAQQASRRQAVAELVERRVAAFANVQRWEEAKWELEPLESLGGSWSEHKHPRAAWLLNVVGRRRQDLAEWTAAEPLLRRALAIDKQMLGSNHPDVATDLNNLAVLLQATNRWAEAEPLMLQALVIDEKNGGPTHANVATDLNNLAQLLKATNRLKEAEPLMRRALAIDEQNYGLKHPSVAIRLHNLASLLHETDRSKEAEPLMRRSLAIDERSYGPNHPEVATDLYNLAGLLQATNRLAEAEPLLRRALAINEKAYGEYHPSVAIGLNNLAKLLQATNRLYEVEPLLRRALAIDEQSYGSDHTNVSRDINNLARLLQDTNRLAEAEPLLRRAMEIDERNFGSEHPKIAIRLNNLAQLLQATNRIDEAEPLMRRVLAIWERSFGPDHPDVATALNNLALLLMDKEDFSDAEPLIRRALKIDEQSYGESHPSVAIRLNNLALLLKATNRLVDAEPLIRRALKINEQSYGENHPDVAISLNNLAQMLQATNRFAEAEVLMRRALKIFEISLGSEHPNVATQLSNLAQLFQATNRLAEAEPLMQRAKQSISSLGDVKRPSLRSE